MKHSHKEKRINFQVSNGKDFLFEKSKNEIDLSCHLIFASPEKKGIFGGFETPCLITLFWKRLFPFIFKKLRILVLNFTLIPLSYF